MRAAFDCDGPDGEKYLPQEVLFRQKEQFSDGVGYDWIDGLKAHAASIVSDQVCIHPIFHPIFHSILTPPRPTDPVPHSVLCSLTPL